MHDKISLHCFKPSNLSNCPWFAGISGVPACPLAVLSLAPLTFQALHYFGHGAFSVGSFLLFPPVFPTLFQNLTGLSSPDFGAPLSPIGNPRRRHSSWTQASTLGSAESHGFSFSSISCSFSVLAAKVFWVQAPFHPTKRRQHGLSLTSSDP